MGSPPLAIRTGLMAAALIPLIIALGGKVNLVTFFTGLGHEKLNVWHRYTGYLMFILSTIHTIPFFHQLSYEGGIANVHDKFYMPGAYEFTGVPPYAFCFGLVALSLPVFRRLGYEIFVSSHILMAIVFFGLCFWHFGPYPGEMDSWWYLWGAMGVWLIQLAGRAFWKTSALKIGKEWLTGFPVMTKRLPDNIMRLDVVVPGTWTWTPGQHAFLRFPKLNLLDNHPFTVASIPQDGHSEKRSDGSNIMSFLVRFHGGATKRLADYLALNADADISVIIDGPYGSVARRLENCSDTVVLVAGGNGIAACLPRLLYLSKALQKGGHSIQAVRLVWMIRSAAHIQWIAAELQAALADAPAETISVDIFVTRDVRSSNGNNSGAIEVEKLDAVVTADALSETEGLAVHFDGRPSLQKLLPTFVGDKRTSIVACGPEGLKIDLSNAVARLQADVLKGKRKEIMLHTETFDW
jgi:predicted ferric reductase